jgi:hypothetical protein
MWVNAFPVWLQALSVDFATNLFSSNKEGLRRHFVSDLRDKRLGNPASPNDGSTAA